MIINTHAYHRERILELLGKPAEELTDGEFKFLTHHLMFRAVHSKTHRVRELYTERVATIASIREVQRA